MTTAPPPGPVMHSTRQMTRWLLTRLTASTMTNVPSSQTSRAAAHT